MRIAINGTGIAGATLAWWLGHWGHEPVLFEKAAKLRTGGYIIDFWGVGFEVAEKMGLIPRLRREGYAMEALRMVDARGRISAVLDVRALGPLLGDRFVSIARGDLAVAIFDACPGVETHFGESIAGVESDAAGAEVTTTLGRRLRFDLVVGADGVHSAVRSQVFGPESQFEKRLPFNVAAFSLQGYRPRDELAYVSHTIPNFQAARVALRGDRTMFLFIWRADAPGAQSGDRAILNANPRALLRRVCGHMEWEVPAILARLEEADDIYIDVVSQICMEHWSRGRVALVGDAAACVSFLAGEGTGLAMAEAYVLAGEIHHAAGEYARGFANYQRILRPLVASRQKSAANFAGFFAPANRLRLLLRDMAIRAASWPPAARWFVRRTLNDNLLLPAYGK